MIARIQIFIPFDILCSSEDKYRIYTIESFGYKIDFLALSRDTNFGTQRDPILAKMDNMEAILCNTIRIDFHKSEFNRRITDNPKDIIFDPPVEVINYALNFFLMRLKWVIQSPKIYPVNLQTTYWQIEYLNDDGSRIPKKDGEYRFKFVEKYDLDYPVLNSEIWNDVFSIPSNYTDSLQQLNWEYLLLDGIAELPQIGPSIALTYTALEVFIANILNRLAENQKSISDEFWQWVSSRDSNHLRQPSVEEEYDTLLHVFTNHSLKDEKILWNAFKHLRTARNQFVHKGIARISSDSEPLTEQQTRELITLAYEIPRKIKEWLPENIKWESHKNYVIERRIRWGLPVPIDRD